MRNTLHLRPKELIELMNDKNKREENIRFMKGRQIYLFDIISVCFVIISLTLYFWLDISVGELISPKYDFDLVYEVKEGGPQSNYYVLDSGHERIINTSKDNRVEAILSSPADDLGDHLYIDNFAVNSAGEVYISASEWEGMNVSRETIIKYSPDFSVQESIIDYEYYDSPITKYRIMGLTEEKGVLSYLYKLDDSVRIVRVENGREKFEEIAYKNAYNAILRVKIVDNNVYVLDKIGKILCLKDGRFEEVYNIRNREKDFVPYDFDIDKKGDCYFVDLKGSSFRKVISCDTSEEVAGTSGTTINTGKAGEFLLCGDKYVQIYKAGNNKLLDKAFKNNRELFVQITVFVLLILFINMAFYILSRAVLVISTLKVSRFKKITFMVLAGVAVIVFLIAGSMLNVFSDAYEVKIVEQLNLCARMVADNIRGEDIKRINDATCFGSKEYDALVDSMEKVFADGDEFCKSLYCNIIKMDEDGQAYAVCYLDQTIGTYYPLGEEESLAATEVFESKNYISGFCGDASGRYLFTEYPVIENGKVVGAIDVGIPDYVANEQIEKMKKEVITSMIAVLLLLGVGISEGSSVLFAYERYKKESRMNEVIIPSHLLRLFIFVVFSAYNMTTSFLPVYILKHSENVTFLEGSLTASLPISINIFLIGVMSLPCARLVRKMGIIKLCAISTICSVVGNAILFFCAGYAFIFLGLILDGIGVGILTNASYVLIAMIKDEVNRMEGFSIYNGACNSGINFGTILGSILAVNLSQQNIFGIVALVWVAVIIFIVILGKKMTVYIDTSETVREQSAQTSFWSLFKSKQVISFFILIQNTYILYSAFVFFYLPIFCDELGYNEAMVSVLMFVFSEIIVVCGDALTKRVSRKFRESGVYLGIVLAIAGIMIFAFLQDMVGMCMAIILLAVAESFERPVSQEVFMNMDDVKKCGEDNSIGVYNFSENIGQALGPTIFARLMSSQLVLFSLSIFNATIAGLGFMYKLINSRSLKGDRS